jgi:small-conductance mechanosensitive channel
LDFIKSVDSVYKEAKLLHASVVNSEKIDRAFERAINVPFYVSVICIILSVLGYNPLALFTSLSTLILGFAFMIGTASSKFFEGCLFILVRRPVSDNTRCTSKPYDHSLTFIVLTHSTTSEIAYI